MVVLASRRMMTMTMNMMIMMVLLYRPGFHQRTTSNGLTHNRWTSTGMPFVNAFSTSSTFIVINPLPRYGPPTNFVMVPYRSQSTSLSHSVTGDIWRHCCAQSNNNNQQRAHCSCCNFGLHRPDRNRSVRIATTPHLQRQFRLFASFNDGSSTSSTSSSLQSGSIITLAPGTRYESELEVKKSRFVAYAQHVDDWSEARTVVEVCKKDHPKARHWCYAYRGVVVQQDKDDDNQTENDSTTLVMTERCNDDGEPSGTAGQPILTALQQEYGTDGGLVDVICVVVRYFGGIKLGAGGLIRAYGGAARQVLRESPISRVVPQTTFTIRGVGPGAVGIVYDSVARAGGTTSNEVYDDIDGRLTVTIKCDSSMKASLQASLQDATRGEIQFGPQ